MKVKFDKSALAKSLQFVRSALPIKEVEPILNNLRFKTLENGVVEIVSTDLDLMSVATCTGTVEREGEVTIPGQKLLSLIGKLNGETITFDCTDTSINITCGNYKGEFKTPGLDDYPSIIEITQKEAIAEFNREKLLVGFKRVNFAVNTDEAKKQLSAVQISSKGLAASNGKVSALYKEAFNVEELCISSNCLTDLISVMDASTVETVSIFEEEAYLVFKFGDNIFFTRKVNVNFPNIFTKIDEPTAKNNNQKITFKVKELKSVIQRVSLTASEDTSVVVFTLLTDTDMKLSAKDKKDFSSEETIKVKVENIEVTDTPYEIGFNYVHILEILNKMVGEDITFSLSDNLRVPARIEEGANFVVFVMRSIY